MKLEEKYLDISVKKVNENFGLFKVEENNKEPLKYLLNKQQLNEKFANDSPQHWMFTDNGMRRYDDAGVLLYDAKGKQIYGINKTSGLKVPLESVTMSISSNPFAKRTYKSNTQINNSTLEDSIGKIFNSITNKVVQNNISQAASAAGAFNQINISKIKCKNVLITGINQTADADAKTISQSTQKAKSTMMNSISTNIKGALDTLKNNGIAAYSEENSRATAAVNDLYGLSTSTPSAAALAIGFGNTGLFDANNKVDSTITKTLKIDDSTTVRSENNIQNMINNNVNQTNLATCVASAGAVNNINIEDMVCGNSLTLTNINQKAYAKAIANCTFDQSAISTITNSIKSQISSSFDQVYDEVLNKIEARYTPAQAKEAYEEYYKLVNKLDALGRLHAAAINTAACATSNNTVDKACLEALQAAKAEEEKAKEPQAIVDTPPAKIKLPPVAPIIVTKAESSNTTLYIIIGVVVLVIFCIILFVALK